MSSTQKNVNSQITYEDISKVFSNYEKKMMKDKNFKFNAFPEDKKLAESQSLQQKKFKIFEVNLEGKNKPKNLIAIKMRKMFKLSKKIDTLFLD